MTVKTTTMDTVNAIKADIEKLPKEYRALIQHDLTALQAHPVAFAEVMLVVGFLIGRFL